MRKEILHLVALAAVIMAICFVGRVDYNDAVIYNMSDETFEVMKDHLGDVSRSEIADAYVADKEYWDSLALNR